MATSNTEKRDLPPDEQITPTQEDAQLQQVKTRSNAPAQPISVQEPNEPYSVYTPGQKWAIVSLISLGGLYSPSYSANIYFPAILTLADDFHKSLELINLTVTMYMIFQGLSPTFWGTMADRYGRRMMFTACLILLSLSCVGLALTPTNAYWLLMVLRCVQAAGSASTIALSAGVVVDIADVHERGGFFGVANLGPMLAYRPAIGPVLGGALSGGLGWRSIFWFLCIASGACALVILLFLPETLRALVGDGRYRAPHYARPWLPLLYRGTDAARLAGPRPKFRNPLRLLLQPDILVLLLCNSMINSILYAATTSTANLFPDIYPYLGDTTLGLCFLTIGGGMAIGTVLVGMVLDADYARYERKVEKKARLEGREAGEGQFPIEKARLRLVVPTFIILIIVTVGLGWCYEARTHIAAPLILLFLNGMMTIALMNMTQTLIVDLMPKQGASITACNNLLRCLIAAGFVSVLALMFDSMGPGWTFVLIDGIAVLFYLPGMLYVLKVGPKRRLMRASA
ncbi:MFS general substrate transporter [Schizophyllum commune Tattone D]|nr:MFS general substrate transporter [Schizophyllum commune Loenen D]KAI5836485.1 MFS general substrate transporter [Schizophyllum commune Tattone D]